MRRALETCSASSESLYPAPPNIDFACATVVDALNSPRMKRIGRGDLVGDGLGAAVGGLGFGGLFQLAAERLGDVLDLGLVGKRLEESLAQDVVDLVGGKIDRRDAAFLPAEFGACIFQRTIDELGARCRRPPRDRRRRRTRFSSCPRPSADWQRRVWRCRRPCRCPPSACRGSGNTAASHRAESELADRPRRA